MPAPAPQHGPSSDLRIADLPEDLRPEAERLKAEYHELAAEAGLLNEQGEFETGKLDDYEFVQHADLDLLTKLAAVGDALADFADHDYLALSPVIQKVVSSEELRSLAFVAKAASQGFTPYQWAGVRTVVRQSGHRVPPSLFVPNGERKLTVTGNLNLIGCTSLTTLPDNLTVMAGITLQGCTSLTTLPDNLTITGGISLEGCTSLTALPKNLTVTRHLGLHGCSPAVQEQGRMLKNAGKIGGGVIW